MASGAEPGCRVWEGAPNALLLYCEMASSPVSIPPVQEPGRSAPTPDAGVPLGAGAGAGGAGAGGSRLVAGAQTEMDRAAPGRPIEAATTEPGRTAACALPQPS